MEKSELINKIAEIMESGSPEGGSRVNHCEELLDSYVESKIVERSAFLNKMILVAYIKIGDMDSIEQEKVLFETKRALSEKLDDNCSFFIVFQEGETRVDVINPKFINQKDFKEYQDRIDLIEEVLKNN